MAASDASPADMRRPPIDPLALDDDTVERLLTGDLPPAQVPPAYARVAELLAAAAAAPSPRELAGQAPVLAELRAVTRARPPAITTPRTAPTARRWRRTGLVAVVVAGALTAGGVAGATTGHLPGPVREAARTILGGAGGAAPAAPTQPVPPAPPTTHPGGAGGGPHGSRPGAASGHGPGPSLAAPDPSPALEGLCRAYAAGAGGGQGAAMEATAFRALAQAAGGEEKVPIYCQDLLPGDQMLTEPKDDDVGSSENSEDPGDPDPPGGGAPDQGRPPPGTGGGGQNRPGLGGL
jgi:hypothetical protein